MSKINDHDHDEEPLCSQCKAKLNAEEKSSNSPLNDFGKIDQQRPISYKDLVEQTEHLDEDKESPMKCFANKEFKAKHFKEEDFDYDAFSEHNDLNEDAEDKYDDYQFDSTKYNFSKLCETKTDLTDTDKPQTEYTSKTTGLTMNGPDLAILRSDIDYMPTVKVRVHERTEDCEKIRVYFEMGGKLTDSITDQIMAPFASLIGLDGVKENIKKSIQYAYMVQRRKEIGLSTRSTSSHMVFSGNPGAGKTEIARLLGSAFYAIGLLDKGHVLETDRTDFVGPYIGWSEEATKMILDAAQGGVLFIDEAYALDPGHSSNDFGHEVLATLTKRMEDNAADFIVVAAGYKQEMEWFVKANTGLRSRFAHFIEFGDYNADEKLGIFKVFCENYDYLLSPVAEQKLLQFFKSIKGNAQDRFGNARGVRNLFDTIVQKQAERLLQEKRLSKKKMMTIQPEDIMNNVTIDDGKIAFLKN